MLAELGLTCQRPVFRATERSAAAVRQWVEVEYPAIREQARAEEAVIYFGDGSGLRTDCQAGTRWSPRGLTPVVRSTGGRVLVPARERTKTAGWRAPVRHERVAEQRSQLQRRNDCTAGR